MNAYPLQLEISGPTAMWTRPDTGSSPVSYVAPTFSAAKGILEAVLRCKSVNVRPLRVEICRPVQFHRYVTNYGGPLRASDAMAKGASFQLFAMVLVSVCYRLYAEAEWNRGPSSERAASPDARCAPHAFQDVSNRRLEDGQWFHIASLAWPSSAAFAGEDGRKPGEGRCSHKRRSHSQLHTADCVTFRPLTGVCESNDILSKLRMLFVQPANLAND